MTCNEWLSIGYSNGLISVEPVNEVSFENAFLKWFAMKLNCIKPQSCDRIEVTYNRYYARSEFINLAVSRITEKDIVDFLTVSILKAGKISKKEYYRILQIVRSVLVYMRDIGEGGVSLFDWSKIKQYIPSYESAVRSLEYAIPPADIEKIMDMVINQNIYPEKRCACLCLCMNFYLGLRIGELASLTFDDFDFQRGVLRVYKTECKYYERAPDGVKLGPVVYHVVDNVKTFCSFREIPIVKEVKFIYEKIKEYHEHYHYVSPYLAFDGADIVLVQSLAVALRNLCDLCEVHYFNSHKIRKTFVTMLHGSGVPTRVISDIVGHKEVSTTERNYILSYENAQASTLQYIQDGIKLNIANI